MKTIIFASFNYKCKFVDKKLSNGVGVDFSESHNLY